jgi:hypothetical protein
MVVRMLSRESLESFSLRQIQLCRRKYSRPGPIFSCGAFGAQGGKLPGTYPEEKLIDEHNFGGV